MQFRGRLRDSEQGRLTVRRRGRLFFFLLALGVAPTTLAFEPAPQAVVDRFLAESAGGAPAPATLWLTPELKAAARQAAGHAPDGARLRYWRTGERTAWVLDRIGKEAPITFGIVVENDRVVALRVLVYRESRGHEIRSPRWQAQFAGVGAGTKSGLDRAIDNITGATLSVRAGRDVARLALFLHREALRSTPAP